jgi:hypothetical protein
LALKVRKVTLDRVDRKESKDQLDRLARKGFLAPMALLDLKANAEPKVKKAIKATLEQQAPPDPKATSGQSDHKVSKAIKATKAILDRKDRRANKAP